MRRSTINRLASSSRRLHHRRAAAQVSRTGRHACPGRLDPRLARLERLLCGPCQHRDLARDDRLQPLLPSAPRKRSRHWGSANVWSMCLTLQRPFCASKRIRDSKRGERPRRKLACGERARALECRHCSAYGNQVRHEQTGPAPGSGSRPPSPTRNGSTNDSPCRVGSHRIGTDPHRHRAVQHRARSPGRRGRAAPPC